MIHQHYTACFAPFLRLPVCYLRTRFFFFFFPDCTRPTAKEALSHPWILAGLSYSEESLWYPPEDRTGANCEAGGGGGGGGEGRDEDTGVGMGAGGDGGGGGGEGGVGGGGGLMRSSPRQHSS